MLYKNIDSLISQPDFDFFLRIAKLGIESTFELGKNLETIYEWEYKYHKIQQAKNMHPKRKENLLNIIEQELSPIIDQISGDLGAVYDAWLKKHALLNPEDWAEARLPYEEFLDYGVEFSLGVIKNEYERYGGSNFEEKFVNCNLEYFIPFFNEIKNDLINYNYDELEYFEEREDEEEIEYTKEIIERLSSMDLNNPHDLKEFINEYYYIESDNLIPKITNDDSLFTMLINFYAKEVFPLWFNKWEAEGIVDTREEIEGIYLDLININELSFNNALSAINIALNAAHQTGSMLEYIVEDHPDVDEVFLSSLSEKSSEEINQWDRALVELGVW